MATHDYVYLPSQTERFRAAVAHASVVSWLLFGPVVGIPLVLLLYYAWRDTSPFVQRQLWRAYLFQLVAGPIAVLPSTGLMTLRVLAPNWTLVVPLVPIIPYITLAQFLWLLTMVVAGVVGAQRAWRGQDFHYLPFRRPI